MLSYLLEMIRNNDLVMQKNNASITHFNKKLLRLYRASIAQQHTGYPKARSADEGPGLPGQASVISQ